MRSTRRCHSLACTTTSASSTSAATTRSTRSTSTTQAGPAPADVQRWQAELNAVGCYSGAVDGALGPETEAAIKAFQSSAGLSADGVVGGQTETALSDAAGAGRQVCSAGTGDDGTGGGGTVDVSSPSYAASFTVRSCDNPTETTLTLTAENESSAELTLQATDGTGTLSIDGGTEEDGIILQGAVASVTVGDAGDVTATGTFQGANLAGEAFTLSGSCA
jgi:peptidoglycan hydrolase-like protein with peptidoglycan-binding domain